MEALECPTSVIKADCSLCQGIVVSPFFTNMSLEVLL